MGQFDAFRYDGKRVLVVGAASGMGAAAAELVQDAGAEVVAMDFAEIKLPGAKAIHVNLADKASIDTAVDECGGPVHALFSCAGVADGTPGIEKINFIGHRYLIDLLLAGGILGAGRRDRLHLLGGRSRLGAEPRAAEGVPRHHATSTPPTQWAHEHNKADYMWSKQAICAYVGARGDAVPQAGDPHQRDLSRPDRHATRAGKQGHVARLRCRLPRRGRRRGGDAARAGVPARVLVQRRRGGDHRHDDDHRRRLLRRRPSPSAFPSATPIAKFLLGRWRDNDAASRRRIYYDPYDFEIDADPYPLWKRMRDEAPLYYNEKYDFYRAEPLRRRGARVWSTGRRTAPGAARSSS